MPNYGDVALQLRADWSRTKYENQEQMLWTVGHEDGISDVSLTKEPEVEHQFRWINPKDENEVTGARMRHYDFVNKSTWSKRLDYLWSWDAEGRLAFGGQVLMARPKEYWLRDQEKRAVATKRASAEMDRDVATLPEGLIATEQPTTRRRRAGI